MTRVATSEVLHLGAQSLDSGSEPSSRPAGESSPDNPDTAEDVYLGRADVAKLVRSRWPHWPGQAAYSPVGGASLAPPSGVSDLGGSASGVLRGPRPPAVRAAARGARSASRGVRSAGNSTALNAPTAAPPGVVLPIALTGLGVGLFAYGAWESAMDTITSHRQLRELRVQRRTLAGQASQLQEVEASALQQDLLAQNEALRRLNLRQRGYSRATMIFPGIMGFVGCTTGGLAFLFYPDLLSAFIPALEALALPLLYVATPVATLFTAAEGFMRVAEFKHSCDLRRATDWLLEHPVIGNEAEVHAMMRHRLRRISIWSAVGATSYLTAAVGTPVALFAPALGLGLLVPSALGIGLSDYVRASRLGYRPRLDLQERLAFASPHSLANEVELAHVHHGILNSVRHSKKTGYVTLLARRRGVKRALAKSWRWLRGHGMELEPRETLREVMDDFLIAEAQRVRNEQGVVEDYLQRTPQPHLRAALQQDLRALQEEEAGLQHDRSELENQDFDNTATAAFCLLQFLVRNNLFKAFAELALRDRRLRTVLDDAGFFPEAPRHYVADANELVMALCEASPLPPYAREQAALRCFEIAECTLLSTGRKQMRQQEAELIDLLAERLVVESERAEEDEPPGG